MLRGFCKFYNEGPKENPLYPHHSGRSPQRCLCWGPPCSSLPGACAGHTPALDHPARSPRLPAARCRVTGSGQGSRLDRENQGLMHKPQKPAAAGLSGGTRVLTLPHGAPQTAAKSKLANTSSTTYPTQKIFYAIFTVH